jgi:hypothetical protein
MASMQELLSSRMIELIQESENPTAEMQMLSTMLDEAGMGLYPFRQGMTPADFAVMSIEENPDLADHLAMRPVSLSNLSGYETPEQLLNRLLPASSE